MIIFITIKVKKFAHSSINKILKQNHNKNNQNFKKCKISLMVHTLTSCIHLSFNDQRLSKTLVVEGLYNKQPTCGIQKSEYFLKREDRESEMESERVRESGEREKERKNSSVHLCMRATNVRVSIHAMMDGRYAMNKRHLLDQAQENILPKYCFQSGCHSRWLFEGFSSHDKVFPSATDAY